MDRHEFVRQARVIGNDGDVIGTLDGVDETSEPPSLVVLLQSDGRMVRIPYHQIDHDRSSAREVVVTIPGHELLISEAPGSEGDVSHQRERRAARTVETDTGADTDHLTVPLAEEELSVRTRDVEQGRVCLRKRVETMPVQETIDVAHDEVDVERVAVNRDIDEMPSVRHEGDTMIVPVVEEVLVVEKRLHLVEEVRVTRRSVTEATTIQDEVRREVLDVTSDPAQETDPER